MTCPFLLWSCLTIWSSLGQKKTVVFSLQFARFNHWCVHLLTFLFHNYIKICWNHFQVWLSLVLTLIVMALVLTALSSLYNRHLGKGRDQLHQRPMIDFDGILFNSCFLLSHLTNQGIYKQFYSIDYDLNSLINA